MKDSNARTRSSISRERPARREQQARERLLDLVGHAIHELPARDVEGLVGDLERSAGAGSATSSNPELVETLAGRSFSDNERLALGQISRLQYFQRRQELLRDSLTASQVARLLGTSRQTPHDRVRSGSLLAVLDRGALRFPPWQFDPEGPDGVLAGMPQVLRSLHVPPLAKLSWLVSPNPVLNGLTPLAALKQGEIERVVQIARGVGMA